MNTTHTNERTGQSVKQAAIQLGDEMLNPREQFEAEHFGIKPAKVGRRYHTAAALPPNAWRRSLKPWAALALGWVGGMLFAVVVIILWKVWV